MTEWLPHTAYGAIACLRRVLMRIPVLAIVYRQSYAICNIYSLILPGGRLAYNWLHHTNCFVRLWNIYCTQWSLHHIALYCNCCQTTFSSFDTQKRYSNSIPPTINISLIKVPDFCRRCCGVFQTGVLDGVFLSGFEIWGGHPISSPH